MRIPQILFGPMYISFGHFMRGDKSRVTRKSQIASAVHFEIRNCLFAGRNAGLSSRVASRFKPLLLSHLRVYCPRPFVWKEAVQTVPSPAWFRWRRASELVESISSNRMICSSNTVAKVLIYPYLCKGLKITNERC